MKKDKATTDQAAKVWSETMTTKRGGKYLHYTWRKHAQHCQAWMQPVSGIKAPVEHEKCIEMKGLC